MEHSKQSKILVVDDEPELREIICDILAPLNVELLTAGNGLEALEIVRNNSIDVVISDIKMPSMNGIEFLKKIREEHFSTIVIFVTGFGDKELMRKAWSLGAFDFIDKPMDEKYLLEVTRTALAYGKSFIKTREEIAEKTKKVAFELNAHLYSDFTSLCEKKNLNKDSIINTILARFIASGGESF